MESQNKIASINKQLNTLERMNYTEHKHNLKLTTDKSSLENNLLLANKMNSLLKKEVNDLSKQITTSLGTIESLESDKRALYRRINQILEVVNDLANDNDSKVNKVMLLLRMNNQQEVQIHTVNAKLVHMTNQRDHFSNALHLIQLKNDELLNANTNYSKQSSTFTEELESKEQEITAFLTKNNHLNAEINTLQNEISALKEKDEKNFLKINEIEKMVRYMSKLLCEKELKIGELNGVVDQMATQRNLLGYQCSKKMEQIKLLVEKNKLMQNIFSLGNRAYNRQAQLIDQLKLNIQNLHRHKGNLQSRIGNDEILRSRLGLANQQLVTALARCRAMESEHPYNLHRWRHLKAVDISQFEMVVKIHHLLKRVIQKTDEVTHLESVIIDKTTVITEMKRILERRPGIEIFEKAKADEKEKEAMSKKLKAVTAERNMCLWKSDRQVLYHKNMMRRMGEEQSKVLELKKINSKLKAKASKLPHIDLPMKPKP